MTALTPAVGQTPSRPAAVTAPLVIGLDVAIGTTGVAGIGWTDHVRTRDKAPLHERFAAQLAGLTSFYRHADFVVIEGAAFALAGRQGMDQLSAMRWMVRHDLWKRSIPYAVVPPDQRLRYLTGTTQPKGVDGKRAKGDELKGIVRAVVADRYGLLTEGRARFDEADAYVMLAMGLDWLGRPLAEAPPEHRVALSSCQWPDREAVTAR